MKSRLAVRAVAVVVVAALGMVARAEAPGAETGAEHEATRVSKGGK